jgi:hypothetical protein
MITKEQKDEVLAREKWYEILTKGKRLMTVEQWEEFAYCLDCNHRKCSHCIRETIAIADIPQLIHGMEGDLLALFFEDYPPQLHDQVIRCSFCGSRRHITEWLHVSLWPELHDIPEIEEAILKEATRGLGQDDYHHSLSLSPWGRTKVKGMTSQDRASHTESGAR